VDNVGDYMTIPAWTIALISLILAVDSFIRAGKDKNAPLYGKSVAWLGASVVYLLIQLNSLHHEDMVFLSRGVWLMVGLTELAYRLGKR